MLSAAQAGVSTEPVPARPAAVREARPPAAAGEGLCSQKRMRSQQIGRVGDRKGSGELAVVVIWWVGQQGKEKGGWWPAGGASRLMQSRVCRLWQGRANAVRALRHEIQRQ